MTRATPPPAPSEPFPPETRGRLRSGDFLFVLAVIAAYLLAALWAIHERPPSPNSMMVIAEQALKGRLDSPTLKGLTDTVEVGGRYYLALGPLQLIAYLPFAAVPALHDIGRYIVPLLFGIPAACLALPMARAWGARGAAAYWIAAFTAFGTLLFWTSVLGNMYYLAHVESFLALSLFLVEWAGRRRPVLLGACLGMSFLARPTTVLAAVPFGLYLVWLRRGDVGALATSALAFAAPIAGAIAFYGWFNWLRFGSPLESGYAVSILIDSRLAARRADGVFSLAQVPENIRLSLLSLPAWTGRFPFIVPDPYGMSMLLVSPALLVSLWAGFRSRSANLLWVAAALVALPVFLYYGGGFVQYGFRYSLDFTPFVVALMALGSRHWIGWPERLLVVASVASVVLGIAWYIR